MAAVAVERNAPYDAADYHKIMAWVSYDKVVETLDEFLDMWKPSKRYPLPEKPIEWICASREVRMQSADSVGALLTLTWEALCASRGGDVNLRHAQALAKEHRVLSGKWLIYIKSAEVDGAWRKIANAVVNGMLGKDAKVSTAEPEEPWVVNGVRMKSRGEGKAVSAEPVPEGKGRKRGRAGGKGKNGKVKKTALEGKLQGKLEGKPPAGMHVICVYTSNFKDFLGPWLSETV